MGVLISTGVVTPITLTGLNSEIRQSHQVEPSWVKKTKDYKNMEVTQVASTLLYTIEVNTIKLSMILKSFGRKTSQDIDTVSSSGNRCKYIRGNIR